MAKKTALITGITGQDGSYLVKFLLDKGYIVHGIKRRSSSFNTSRIDYLYKDPHTEGVNFFLHYGDLTDTNSIYNIINKIKPDEIYNLGAQSHVGVSFENPEYTAEVSGIGTLRILEAIKFHGFEKITKFYQAGTSEMFGKVKETPQNEKTSFYPRSPYGVAKVYAHWITINYREAYNIFACNGILFNHESPVRGETFVTRKIVIALCRIKNGLQKKLYLGNLDAKRDWGHAGDFVEGMWKMLQQEKPEDFVLATGVTTTIREFTERAFAQVGVTLEWSGSSVDEVGTDAKNGKIVVSIDSAYFRPTEVDLLIGDASKAREKLGWNPTCDLQQMIEEMIKSDLEEACKDQHLHSSGFQTNGGNWE